MELRPFVKRFAEEMERKLRENDYKEDKFEHRGEILARIIEETGELFRSCYIKGASLSEAADVANMCGMLVFWDGSELPDWELKARK